MNMEENSSLKYEDRYVAFVDILGFKNLVKNSVERLGVFTQIMEALKTIHGEKEINDSNLDYIRCRAYGREVTTFSDSIVISYSAENKLAGYYLAYDLSYITLKLLSQGISIRGGASLEKLVHTEKYCFGSAMNKAYEIESKIAVYPRIVIDNGYYEAMMLAANGDEEVGEDIKNFVSRDNDGMWYINFAQALMWDIGEYEPYFEDCISAVEKQIAEHNDDLYVRSKYEWLKRYLMSV